jgi:predicted SAM-dependent methyltransferase
VYGSDYDARYVEFGRQRGLALRAGSLEELLSEPPADLLILSHIVEHQNSPLAFLREALRLVRPGGWTFIAVPGLEHIREDYMGDWLLYLQICHTYHFTRKTLSTLAAAAGLCVEKADDSVRILARCGVDEKAHLKAEAENPARVLAALKELEADWLQHEPRRQFRRRVRRLWDALRGTGT